MWELAGKKLTSRLLLGTSRYPSLQIMGDAIRAAQTEVVTVSLKRQLAQQQGNNEFWNYIKSLNCHWLPNTAGCRTAEEAITMAEMSREIFQTNWIKLEVIGDDYTLQPDSFGLLAAAKVLVQKGFMVFPYCTEDLILCQRLLDCGCTILMPWGSPIGSGKGLINLFALELLRTRLSDAILIIDAGIGKPSHATQAMEMGFDGILLNTAISCALNPVAMAEAFRNAVIAGRTAYKAGLIPEKNLAQASTPLVDTPFWLQSEV